AAPRPARPHSGDRRPARPGGVRGRHPRLRRAVPLGGGRGRGGRPAGCRVGARGRRCPGRRPERGVAAMPGGKERELRRRFRSVQSTKKISKAVELIAASRIAKAQARASAARPYSDKLTEVIRNLAAAGAGGGSPLLEERDEVRT